MLLKTFPQVRELMTFLHDSMATLEERLIFAVSCSDDEVQASVDADNRLKIFTVDGLWRSSLHWDAEIPVLALVDELGRAERPACIKAFLPAGWSLIGNFDRSIERG